MILKIHDSWHRVVAKAGKKKHHKKWFISGIWISRALCRMTSSVSMFARLSPRNQWDHWALQQLDEATCWKIAVHLQKETKPAHLKSLKNHLKPLLSVSFCNESKPGKHTNWAFVAFCRTFQIKMSMLSVNLLRQKFFMHERSCTPFKESHSQSRAARAHFA